MDAISADRLPEFALDNRTGAVIDIFGDAEFRDEMILKEEEYSLLGLTEITVTNVTVQSYKIIFWNQSGAGPTAEVVSIEFAE